MNLSHPPRRCELPCAHVLQLGCTVLQCHLLAAAAEQLIQHTLLGVHALVKAVVHPTPEPQSRQNMQLGAQLDTTANKQMLVKVFNKLRLGFHFKTCHGLGL